MISAALGPHRSVTEDAAARTQGSECTVACGMHGCRVSCMCRGCDHRDHGCWLCDAAAGREVEVVCRGGTLVTLRSPPVLLCRSFLLPPPSVLLAVSTALTSLLDLRTAVLHACCKAACRSYPPLVSRKLFRHTTATLLPRCMTADSFITLVT